MAGTIAIVAALVAVIVGIAAQGPVASVRATIEAGPASSVSRSVSWHTDAGDRHPSSAAVRAALRKEFAGLPVTVEQDAASGRTQRWTVAPDAARIRPEQLASVRRAESRLGDVVRGLPGMSDTPVTVAGGGSDMLARMEQANAALFAVLPVPASVLAVAGVIALALLAQLLVDARDNETRLLRARGASVRAIVFADGVEISVAAIAGCLLGAAAAAVTLAFIVGAPTATALLLPCAGVLVGSVAVVVAFSALVYWNCDAWVVRANLDRFAITRKLDVSYLARGLSADGYPALVQALPRMKPDDRASVVAKLNSAVSRERLTASSQWFEWNLRRDRAMDALRSVGIHPG